MSRDKGTPETVLRVVRVPEIFLSKEVGLRIHPNKNQGEPLVRRVTNSVSGIRSSDFGTILRIFTIFILVFLLSFSASASQKVPIAFNDYHGYTNAVKYIKEVAASYPNITELIEIGKSGLGRPIYVLVISNMKSGTTIDRFVEIRHPRNAEIKEVFHQKSYEGKPGQWIDGGMHGNEYTGTEVCLYIIDKLVSGYGSNSEISAAVDNKVFYICPVVNPDGVFNSVEREISQRGNGDLGAAKEPPRDLNGDGHITQFRFKDPKGVTVIDDKEPRLMVRLSPTEQPTKARYSVVTEGQKPAAEAARGRVPEAGVNSIDVNRNFPEGWWTDDNMFGGSGPYPTSSPEARALVEFAVNHRNILMTQNFHTSGGFTYRVPGTAADTAMAPKDIAVYDLVLGKKYLETIGEKVPEAWQKPDQMADFKAKLRGTSKNKYAIERGYEMPRGWIMGYNEEREQRYGYGMVIDWWYQQYGSYAVTTELWNPANDIPGFPKIDLQSPDSRNEQERALLKINDEKYGGKLFVDWKPFKHPELGEGEIGGWIPKYRSNALPGEPLLGVCEKHWQFEFFRNGLLPAIAITEAKAKVLYETANASAAQAIVQGDQVTIKKGTAKGKYKIVEVTATIENQGPLATHIARGAELRGNREDVVWLIGDRDKTRFLQGDPYLRLGVLEGQMKLPGSGGATAGPQRGGRGGVTLPPTMPQMPPGIPGLPGGQRGQSGARQTQPQQTSPRREVKWLVAVESDAPLKIVVTSQKGGTAFKELVIR